MEPIIHALILDMDGVLWRDTQPIGDLPWIFDEINRKNLKVTLATNNATKSAEEYLEKLHSFGVELELNQIINSADATAHYLLQRFPKGGPVYIVGERGILHTLEEKGFFLSDQDVIAVVVAMDRGISYGKLATASKLIRAGSLFLGTNPDNTYPTPQGLMPGAGSILAAIQAASGASPTIIGKPSPIMFEAAFQRMSVRPGDTLAVGDRLETDIAGGRNAGCMTGLVLTGVTDKSTADEWIPAPDFVEADLTSLIKRI